MLRTFKIEKDGRLLVVAQLEGGKPDDGFLPNPDAVLVPEDEADALIAEKEAADLAALMDARPPAIERDVT